MIEQPVLETKRLRLRALEPSDASTIQQAANERKIADTMISLPFPYPVGEAERYLAKQQIRQQSRQSITYIIEGKVKRNFLGLIEVRDINIEHFQAELSFWIVVKEWGKGYMSEAVQAILRYGFEILELNRLYAYHMLRNQATSRVLAKNGFTREGVLRQRVWKWDKFEDVALWAILKEDWQKDPIKMNAG
jgi:RimJ/RimL family protein N-acetyltransferase